MTEVFVVLTLVGFNVTATLAVLSLFTKLDLLMAVVVSGLITAFSVIGYMSSILSPELEYQRKTEAKVRADRELEDFLADNPQFREKGND